MMQSRWFRCPLQEGHGFSMVCFWSEQQMLGKKIRSVAIAGLGSCFQNLHSQLHIHWNFSCGLHVQQHLCHCYCCLLVAFFIGCFEEPQGLHQILLGALRPNLKELTKLKFGHRISLLGSTKVPFCVIWHTIYTILELDQHRRTSALLHV